MRKKDWIFLVSLFILIFLGIVMILSLSVNDSPPFFSFKKQLLAVIISFFAFISFASWNWRFFRNSPFFILVLYFFAIFLLGLLFIFGDEVKGVRGWFDFGFFSLQPIELTKISVLLLLAKYFSSRHLEVWQIKHLLISGSFVVLPTVLTIMQPDLASAAILGFIWLGIVLVSGIRFRQILLLFLFFSIIAAFSWFFVLHSYQKERLISFLNPEIDPRGGSYHQKQALIAIGSGSLFGKGLGAGTQTKLGFLPSAKTDFIFAAVGEELGFFGITILLTAFVIFFSRLIYYTNFFTNNFCRLFTAGFAIKILSETFINIGMNLGMLPVAGVPLPFVSFGGSHFLANFIALGIIWNMIKTSQPAALSPDSQHL